MRVVAWIASGVALLALAYGAFLGWRVMDARARAPHAVRAILANADPATSKISDARIETLLRVEDPTFWTNDGIDLTTPGAGATTLAQGLGKSIFFEKFKPSFSKIELMILTRFALVATVSKKDILQATLANVYLGHHENRPVRGFAVAARRWFGKEVQALSDREFLGLVAMMIGPNKLDPIRHRNAHDQRVNRIERYLAGECRPRAVMDVELEGC